MALERVPADIRKDGGVARMSDPKMIKEIKAAVTIPVMAKARIGHFVECQILQEVSLRRPCPAPRKAEGSTTLRPPWAPPPSHTPEAQTATLREAYPSSPGQHAY